MWLNWNLGQIINDMVSIKSKLGDLKFFFSQNLFVEIILAGYQPLTVFKGFVLQYLSLR